MSSEENLNDILELLKEDPDNEELLSIKKDLEEIISLEKTTELKKPIIFTTGQTVMVKYTDKRYHEAVITSVPIEPNKEYAIIYTHWTQPGTCKLEDLKEFDADLVVKYKPHVKKRTKEQQDKDPNKKTKKKQEEEILTQKQSQWQSFNSKKK